LNRKQRAFPSLFVISFPLVVKGKGRGGGYQRVVAIGFPMILFFFFVVLGVKVRRWHFFNWLKEKNEEIFSEKAQINQKFRQKRARRL
jgi:hypothetical protein|tara:strand:+ start:124 stop:387 length:264 start_codon:yes stop_codon:yes gene_type:complete